MQYAVAVDMTYFFACLALGWQGFALVGEPHRTRNERFIGCLVLIIGCWLIGVASASDVIASAIP